MEFIPKNLVSNFLQNISQKNYLSAYVLNFADSQSLFVHTKRFTFFLNPLHNLFPQHSGTD